MCFQHLWLVQKCLCPPHPQKISSLYVENNPCPPIFGFSDKGRLKTNNEYEFDKIVYIFIISLVVPTRFDSHFEEHVRQKPIQKGS